MSLAVMATLRGGEQILFIFYRVVLSLNVTNVRNSTALHCTNTALEIRCCREAFDIAPHPHGRFSVRTVEGGGSVNSAMQRCVGNIPLKLSGLANTADLKQQNTRGI